MEAPSSRELLRLNFLGPAVNSAGTVSLVCSDNLGPPDLSLSIIPPVSFSFFFFRYCETAVYDGGLVSRTEVTDYLTLNNSPCHTTVLSPLTLPLAKTFQRKIT